jgi:hypothetical protein
MKKRIAIAVFLVFLVSGVFAQKTKLSVGGGAYGDFSFNNGIKIVDTANDSYMGFRNHNFGGFVFFDAAFLEATISISYGAYKNIFKENLAGYSTNDSWAKSCQLGVSLLFKYPIEISSISIFPLLGFSYFHILYYKDIYGRHIKDQGLKSTDLDQWGALAGAGIDYHFTPSLYLRAAAMIHLRFDIMAFTYVINTIPGSKTTLGLGPRFKLGVGYRF